MCIFLDLHRFEKHKVICMAIPIIAQRFSRLIGSTLMS